MPSSRDRAAAQRIRALVDRATPRVRQEIDRALQSLARSASVSAIERALSRGDALALHDLVALLPLRLRGAVRILQQLYLEGLGQGVGEAQRLGLRIRFDFADPAVIRAAESEVTASLVTGVTSETRRGMRALVTEGVRSGIPPRQLAPMVKPMLGLSALQTRAVWHRVTARVTAGESRAAALRWAKGESERLLRRRAMTIARTETIGAATRGHLASWKSAQRAGILSREARKVWLVTPDDRLCFLCRPLHNQTTTLGGMFSSGGYQVEGPPLHPNCRCAVAVQVLPVAQAQAA